MAGDRGPRRRTTDPLLIGITEGVAAGYRALEYVAVGIAESARRTSAPRYASARPYRQGEERAAGPSAYGPRTARRRAAGRRSAPSGPGGAAGATEYMPRPVADARAPTLLGEFADLTADVLDRFGEAFRDIAEGDRFEPSPDVPKVELEAYAGRKVGQYFNFSNLGSAALEKIGFVATPLLGAGYRIDVGAVGFEHGSEQKPTIGRMRPGEQTEVTVTIDVPKDAPPGAYHGVVVAESKVRDAGGGGGLAGAWALLELEVLATDA